MKCNTYILVFMAVLLFSSGAGTALAEPQTSQSSLYVPLIGISSVPSPLALPNGPGNVTYNYAVKNFLSEHPLANITVTDDKCSPIKYIEGDDNNNGELDYTETWRYRCTTKLLETTQSIATATGSANNLSAAHKAYATVVVGSDKSAPLVNIINVTKVAYPLALPSEGGDITFTYRVNNPGIVPLGNVIVTDDKCHTMSSKLGDTNNNNLLDIYEVWIFTCTTHLVETTTNTVSVLASANGFKAVGYATITVTVSTPKLPDTGSRFNAKIIIWSIMLGALIGLTVSFFSIRKKKLTKKYEDE